MPQVTEQYGSASLRVEERYLLDVLAAFFNNKAAPDPPDELDVEALTQLAKRQKVAPLLAYVSLSAPNASTPAILAKCGSALNAAVEDEALQTQEFNALNQAFREAGVCYMPLKGFLMRDLYPEAYLRTMSDYDVLVRPEDFDKAREALERQGYEYVKGDEHHDVFLKAGRFMVEQHYKLFNASGAFERGRSVSWKRLVAYESTEYRFTDEDFYRYMLEHLLKHWIQSQTVLRDYLDVAIYLRARGATLDRKKLDADLDSAGTLEFVKNIERLVDAWFGHKPLDAVLTEMTLYQFFRHETNATSDEEGAVCCYSSYLASSATDGKKKRFARIRHLLTIFPQRVNYEVVHRLRGVPTWKKPWVATKLFFKFWHTRLTRKNFYRNLRTFLSANEKQVSAAAAFQRRAGLDPSRFNAQDWKEDD